MVWINNKYETLGSTSDTMDATSMTASQFGVFLNHAIPDSNSTQTRYTVNGVSSGSKYASRQSKIGATDVLAVSQDEVIYDSGGETDDKFSITYACDIAGEEKLFIGFGISRKEAGGGNAPTRSEVAWKYVTTSARVTSVRDDTSSQSGTYAVGSNLSCLSDAGGETLTFLPTRTNTIYLETDTAKYKWWDGSEWLRDGSEHGATRGLFAGGYDTSDETATIEYITFATLGNATDFGDRTENRMKLGACADGTKACFAGGESANSDTIDYVTILTTGNATDFGNLTSARNGQGGCTTSTTRGLFSGGGSVTTTIDYITIATTGNATDFGDHAPAHGTCTVSDLTRALIHIHEGTSDYYNEDIEYVTIDTTGNATDFGDIIEGKSGTGAVSNLTRAVIAGGKYTSGASNVRTTMDYVTIQTLGNGTDFGDLTTARSSLAGCSSTTKGVFGGGYNGSNFNTIDYITIDTVGNATDFGDLTTATRALAGASDLY